MSLDIHLRKEAARRFLDLVAGGALDQRSIAEGHIARGSPSIDQATALRQILEEIDSATDDPLTQLLEMLISGAFLMHLVALHAKAADETAAVELLRDLRTFVDDNDTFLPSTMIVGG